MAWHMMAVKQVAQQCLKAFVRRAHQAMHVPQSLVHLDGATQTVTPSMAVKHQFSAIVQIVCVAVLPVKLWQKILMEN